MLYWLVVTVYCMNVLRDCGCRSVKQKVVILMPSCQKDLYKKVVLGVCCVCVFAKKKLDKKHDLFAPFSLFGVRIEVAFENKENGRLRIKSLLFEWNRRSIQNG